MKKFLFGFLALVLGLALIACKPKKPVEHEVKFYVGEELHKTVKVEDGKKVDKSMLEEPSLEGFEFIHWAHEGKEFKFETEIKKDYEIHAVFEEINIPEPTLKEYIQASFANNNYQVNTDLYYYDELKESVEAKFAGNISSYQDTNVHEIRVINKNKVNVYQKQGENWKKLADRDVLEGYNIFDYINEEDFDKVENKYVLKGASYQALDEYFGLEIEVEFVLRTFEIIIENGKVSALNYKIEIDTLDHFVKMKFSNYGTIVLEVPTV